MLYDCITSKYWRSRGRRGFELPPVIESITAHVELPQCMACLPSKDQVKTISWTKRRNESKLLTHFHHYSNISFHNSLRHTSFMIHYKNTAFRSFESFYLKKSQFCHCELRIGFKLDWTSEVVRIQNNLDFLAAEILNY